MRARAEDRFAWLARLFAVAFEPGELGRGADSRKAALEDEDSVLRSAKDRFDLSKTHQHLFADGHGLARQLQALLVKRLRHQRPVAPEEQMTRRINRVSVLFQNQLVLARIERADINAVDLIPSISSRKSGAINEVAAVGQEVREVVHLLFARLVHRQGGGRAAR